MNFKIKRCFKPILILALTQIAFPQSIELFAQNQKTASHLKQRPEVIYHVVQRSFYDSNADSHGDFAGLKSKLDYLEDLGITAIMLLPIVESPFYHNYFSGNHEKIDPKFGSMQDWIELVKEAHKRDMKIYMDLEFQYITEDHEWFKDAIGNPKSPFSNYLLFNEPGNKKPESIIFNLTELTGYDQQKRTVTTINLKSPEVQGYFLKLLLRWADPNGDGKFDDGVDGFRLDHMMDKLDGKEKLNNLFATFWKPLITNLKTKNKNLIFIAEQADWNNFGESYFEQGGVDRVFAFKLREAIASMNKKKIMGAADSTFSKTPPGKQQIVFLENHDMTRIASAIPHDVSELKAAAALSLLIGGIPAIYYGQELGMKGDGGFQKFGNTDGNDIPVREAFEWFKSDSGNGMAIWYKNTGPWWDQTNLKANDGISLEEQNKDPNSLFKTYQELLKVRKKEEGLANGRFSPLQNPNEEVVSFQRKKGADTYIIAVNLSDDPQKTQVDLGKNQFYPSGNYSSLFGNEKAKLNPNQKLDLDMKPFGIGIYKVK